jgi:hypothetical protein
MAARLGYDKATVYRVVIRAYQQEGIPVGKEGFGRPKEKTSTMVICLKLLINKNADMNSVECRLSMPELSSIC